ncbi:hypothetical protein SDC9_212136 [bioreactor metagenome]|uniref:Uncharacterized protein n=1 Tax=bioreactor metagenome TaxID=1076179 RepID=A0A645JXU2_9ZZZZ
MAGYRTSDAFDLISEFYFAQMHIHTGNGLKFDYRSSRITKPGTAELRYTGTACCDKRDKYKCGLVTHSSGAVLVYDPLFLRVAERLS